VIYQALKNPDIKVTEIKKLEDGIDRFDKTLKRRLRQPWDKKDDAP
jgi:hypothetical protein